jgi:hypothetical protein
MNTTQLTELTANIWADGNFFWYSEQWFKFTATAETQYLHFSPGVGIAPIIAAARGNLRK